MRPSRAIARAAAAASSSSSPPATTTEHYHILGAGAMGCLYGASLKAKAGVEVSLLRRPPQAEEEGLPPPPSSSTNVMVKVMEGHKHANTDASSPFILDYSSSVRLEVNTGEGPPISRLLVITKAYDVLPALTTLAPRLNPESVVVLLSNGALGFYEEIKASPALRHVNRWVLGTSTHGVILTKSPLARGGDVTPSSSYCINHTGMGETFLGLPLDEESSSSAAEQGQGQQDQKEKEGQEAALESIMRDFAPAGLALVKEAPRDMHRRLWLKLAVNACINPLTGILKCRNGHIAEDEGLRPLITALCEETAALAAALEEEKQRKLQEAGKERRGPPAFLPTAEELEKYVMQVAVQTEKNQSSMLRDILTHRRTEIDYISGYIVREAHRLWEQEHEHHHHELAVPKHEMMLQLIKVKEALQMDA